MRIKKRNSRRKNLRPNDLRLKNALRLFVLGLLVATSLPAQKPEPPAPVISAYVIDAELDPATHHLAARTVVSFTAPENAEVVSFGFHPALKVTKISDESGKILTSERAADGTLRVIPVAPLTKDQLSRWTFAYEGTITGKENGPEQGMRLAAIQEPIAYLLYSARWFPSTGYLINRYTAEMHIRVPQ